jgi:hypothetical protein
MRIPVHVSVLSVCVFFIFIHRSCTLPCAECLNLHFTTRFIVVTYNTVEKCVNPFHGNVYLETSTY